MADPFADSSDVAVRWRPLSSADQATADALCQDASAAIRARFPGIDSQVTTGGVDSDVLTMVVAGMVKRAMIGGMDGIASQSQAVGPFPLSQTFANPMGNVFLTASDLVAILGYQPSGQSNGFANDTTKCSAGDSVNLYYDTLTVLP